MICNGGPNPLNQPLPKDIINVKAGDKLAAEWHHTLDSTPETDKSDPIDPGHLGPIMVYLAKVDSALTTTVTGLKWFKIYEDGMDSNGTWAVTRLYNNKGKVEFTLPKCIQNGQYVSNPSCPSSLTQPMSPWPCFLLPRSRFCIHFVYFSRPKVDH